MATLVDIAGIVIYLRSAAAVEARQHLEQRFGAMERDLERARREAADDRDALVEHRATGTRQEAVWSSQLQELQQQLAAALQQLGAKDREHGKLLRTLVDQAEARSGRRKPVRVRAE